MPLTFQFKPISELKFDMRGIVVALRAAMVEEGEEQAKLLRKTVRTWKGDKPRFLSEVRVSPTQITLSVDPTGDGADIWNYLEHGTKTRWAVMVRGFRPKTRRAHLGSFRGRGGPVILGKRAMMKQGIKARPGIKARNWRAEVARERSRKFKGLLQRVFGLIARNTITPRSLRNR